MKKLTILTFSILFTISTSAFAGGMIGVKYGNGDLEGNAKSYTAGSTTYAAESGSKDNEFGAIFAEINIKESPISVGLEYVPFDADISLNGKSANVSANVGDYTTLYALAMKELDSVSVYAKLGYSMADIGTVKDAGKLGVSIVIRSEDQLKIDKCSSEVLEFVNQKKIEVVVR